MGYPKQSTLYIFKYGKGNDFGTSELKLDTTILSVVFA